MAKTHGERLVSLEERLDHLEDDVGSIKVDVREIRDALLKGKGGWKVAVTLFALAGVVATSLITAWAMKAFGFSPSGEETTHLKPK